MNSDNLEDQERPEILTLLLILATYIDRVGSSCVLFWGEGAPGESNHNVRHPTEIMNFTNKKKSQKDLLTEFPLM